MPCCVRRYLEAAWNDRDGVDASVMRAQEWGDIVDAGVRLTRDGPLPTCAWTAGVEGLDAVVKLKGGIC